MSLPFRKKARQEEDFIELPNPTKEEKVPQYGEDRISRFFIQKEKTEEEKEKSKNIKPKRKKKECKTFTYEGYKEEDLRILSIILPHHYIIQAKSLFMIDGIKTFRNFFGEIIRMYVERDECFIKAIEQMRTNLTYHGKRSKKVTRFERIKADRLKEKFLLLDPEEKKWLFDILEEEINDEEMKII